MANRNGNVPDILKLAYEFDRSIAKPGSRADDLFLQRLYCPTLLDSQLMQDIRSDKYDLVLITGNPGDGKSAFLDPLGEDSGPHLTEQGREIVVLHDATEPTIDPGNRAASAIADLEVKLAILTDSGWDPDALSQRMFVVGINRGLLAQAFLSRTSHFGAVRDPIRQAMRRGWIVDAPVKIAIVDLNYRATVCNPLEEERGLFDGLMSRLISEDLWEDSGCRSCDASGWCPFYANARLLRAKRPMERFRLLWFVNQLTSERHTTVRDLLAGLAYVLVGHEDMFKLEDKAANPTINPCAYVEREFGSGMDDEGGRSFVALFRRLVYNSAFVDEDVFEGRADMFAAGRVAANTFGMAPAVVRDGLNVRDPGRRLSSPFWDDLEESVVSRPPTEIDHIVRKAEKHGNDLEAAAFRALGVALASLATELDDLEPSDGAFSVKLEDYKWMHRFLVRVAKRRAFFLDKAMPLEEATSFSSLALFLKTLSHAHAVQVGAHVVRAETLEAQELVLFEILPDATAKSEGIMAAHEGMLAGTGPKVRWSETPDDVGAIIALPADDYELVASQPGSQYVEFYPRELVYRPVRQTGTYGALVMGLATFEGVVRLAQGSDEGYSGVPRATQLRNFREALRAEAGGDAATSLYLVDFATPSKQVRIKRLGERLRFD